MFPLLVSRRYLFSKKSMGAINIISMIAVAGIAVTTMALVLVLSVFNGFQGLVADMFTSFDPELRVTPRRGTTIALASAKVDSLRSSKDVACLTPVVEGQALVMIGGQQQAVVLKGVDDNFLEQSHLADVLYGEAELTTLHIDMLEFCVPGILLCSQLALPLDFAHPLQVYAPKRGERVNMANPQSSLNRAELYSSGLAFGVHQQKYDAEYILCSLGFAQRLFDQEGMATALEIKLSPRGKRSNIESLLGPDFLVQDRYEQQEDVFRIMKIEKLISYAFLCFILFVACLNIVGSLSMLIIEKKQDIGTLFALGATHSQVRRIFIFEGMQIILGGALVGTLLAAGLCLAQQHFGLISMGQSDGSFIIDAYPVEVQVLDLLTVLLTVLLLGYASVRWATRHV